MNKAKQPGFSLIELIFVIAIIGVMASLGVSYYQHRAENTKIEKAALQVQQIMQAGQAYYNDNNKWPSSTPTAQDNPNFINYIPGQKQPLNPWGQKILWQTIPTGGATQLFRVHTAVPAGDTKKIAALLPNAQIGSACSATGLTTTNNTVCADVGKFTKSKQYGTLISSIGSWDYHGNNPGAEAGTAHSVNVDCPDGMKAGVFDALNDARLRQHGASQARITVTTDPCHDSGSKDPANGLEQWNCAVRVRGKNYDRYGVSYLGLCTPKA